MLRKAIVAAIILLAGTPIQAQEEYSLACQYVEAGGLIWENNNWKPTSFFLGQPFFLSVENNELSASSVGPVFGGSASYQEEVSCLNSFNRVTTCVAPFGDTLFLNHETNSGGVSKLYGSGSAGDDRDTVVVKAFICQRM